VISFFRAFFYTDNLLDAHEDYLVHKLARLLNLDHRELIEAKMKILGQKKAT
jgi:hypothetical protein